MMTAEQFDFQAEYDKYLADGFADPVRFAKFCVAAQLAEKEREIADLQTKCRDMAVALGNQIARAEAAEQRWIAVGERLPDEPQHDVLLWTADDWEGGKNFQQVGVIGEFNRDEWDGKVTHWQPLPSPPTEAQYDDSPI